MSARQTIEVPSIGDYKDVPVIELFVKPGDVIAVEDPLLSLESDKATLEVPSPVAGKVVEVLVAIGAKVSQGVPIVVVEAAEGAAPPAPAPAPAESVAPPAAPAPAPERAAAPAPVPQAPVPAPAAPQPAGSDSRLAHASPSVRAFARELGVDVGKVPATGRKGRVLREDVAAFVKQQMSAPAGGAGAGGQLLGIPPAPTYDFSKYGEIERIPLTRIQQISGTFLHRNWVTIPHVTNFDEADITDIEAFRVKLNNEKREPKVKLTMLAFMVKAVAHALAVHPRFNSSLDGDGLILKKYIHVGVAVDTPRGLVVPVVRDCDRKGVIEIGLEIAALAEKARDGKLTPADMEGGSMSISSLGGVGGTSFTPIINAPEVAILGATRAQMKPVWDGSAFQPRLIQPLNLSWDHRVIDGVAAARFLVTVAETLGDLRRALL